jgi:hypothetical protein
VVTIAEGTAGAAHELVEPARESDFEAFDSARERAPVDGFDQQMQVVGLHGEVNDANQPAVVRLANRAFDEREAALASHVDHVAGEPQRDVHWVTIDVVRSASVGDDTLLLAPRVLPRAAPRTRPPQGQARCARRARR